jgi:hypothetical protein
VPAEDLADIPLGEPGFLCEFADLDRPAGAEDLLRAEVDQVIALSLE